MTKRGVDNILEYVEPFTFIEQIETAKLHPYTVDVEIKVKRDKGLIAFLALTGMRISEVLRIDCSQVKVNDDAQYVIVRSVQISKRWKHEWKRNSQGRKIGFVSRKRLPIKKDFPLPKTGRFSPLTKMVLDHLDNRKEGLLFDLSRYWAWKIVRRITGNWCHYFRSMRISYLVNEQKIPTVAVADMLGIEDPKTISHYYKGGWKLWRTELK